MKKIICKLLILILTLTATHIPAFAVSEKASALQELADIYKLYDDFDYTEENWALLESAYHAGIDSINNSSGTEAIYNALNTAAENMISITSKYRNSKICISADKFTLNKGFIIVPEFMTVKKYSPVSKVIYDFFEKKYSGKTRDAITYNGTLDNGFELTSIYEESAVCEPYTELDLPNYLLPHISNPVYEKTGISPLTVGDYTTDSCFMYSVNNKFPNVKASAIPLVDEDVLRIQFSIYGKGADLGANTYYSLPSISTFADKSELLWEIAATNQKYDLDVVLTDETNLKNYNDAFKAVVISDVSQKAIDKALKKIKVIVPVEPPAQSEPLHPDTPEIPEIDINFTDIDETHFAYEAILQLAAKEILNGYPDGTFGANNTLTRGELVTMLARAEGYTGQDEVPFEDVSKNDWFYCGVSFCYNNGITNGQTITKFNPHAKITRQELATMLYRYAVYAKLQLKTVDKPGFSDAHTFAEFATDAIIALHRAEIINGYDGNVFNPHNNATRAETAKMLYLLIN